MIQCTQAARSHEWTRSSATASTLLQPLPSIPPQLTWTVHVDTGLRPSRPQENSISMEAPFRETIGGASERGWACAAFPSPQLTAGGLKPGFAYSLICEGWSKAHGWRCAPLSSPRLQTLLTDPPRHTPVRRAGRVAAVEVGVEVAAACRGIPQQARAERVVAAERLRLHDMIRTMDRGDVSVPQRLRVAGGPSPPAGRCLRRSPARRHRNGSSRSSSHSSRGMVAAAGRPQGRCTRRQQRRHSRACAPRPALAGGPQICKEESERCCECARRGRGT